MTPAESETGLFWLLLFFAPYIAVSYLAGNGGVPPHPGRAIARFLRARWRQARGYTESWVAEYDGDGDGNALTVFVSCCAVVDGALFQARLGLRFPVAARLP